MKSIALVLFLISSLAFATEVNLGELDGSELEIEVSLTPEEAVPQKQKKVGFSFSRLPIENEGFQTGREGLPEIPVLHRWLVVRPDAKYKFQILPGSYKVYKNILLYPAQADVTEEEIPAFQMEKGAYLKNVWYGARRAQLGQRIRLGEAVLLPISFWPVAYNPAKRELRVFEKIRVKISVSEPESPKKPIELSQFAAEQISQLALNGKSFLARKSVSIRNQRMLLVYGEKFQSFVDELSQLHRSLGTDTAFVKVLSETSSAELKEKILSQYQVFKMDAVLIVGDESHVPLKEFGGKTGDFSYSLLSGDDQVSDVSMGRIPVKNEVQAQTMLNKIFRYVELSLQGYSNKKVMLIAHNQEYPGKYTRNMETVRKSSNPLNLEFNTQYGGETAKNSTVIAEAQKGYAIINYRGHGSATSWSGWGSDGASFSLAQIKALPDVDTGLAFVFNVACTNGAIQNSSPALVERQLFPNDNPESLQGAIGTFGATAPSLTEVNHRFNIHLFSFLQGSQNKTIGNIYSLSNNQLTKDNAGKATTNTRMYVLYSDPLLIPWVQ